MHPSPPRAAAGRPRHTLIVALATVCLPDPPAAAPAAEPPEEGLPAPSTRFEQDFGPYCGATATATYDRALRGGARWPEALVSGIGAGRDCLARVGRAIHEHRQFPPPVLATPDVTPRPITGP